MAISKVAKKEYQVVLHAAVRAIEENGIPCRVLCPVCAGGHESERSLSIWEGEDGLAMATCHRSTCPVGTVSMSRSYSPQRLRPESRSLGGGHVRALMTARPLAYDISRLFPQRDTDGWVVGRYFLQHPTDLDRYVMPMYDENMEVRGAVSKLKKWVESSAPKALTFLYEGYNGMSWYRTGGTALSEDLWVVEDGLSAFVLNLHGYDAVSLNGTNLNAERIDVLRKAKWKIHLCLDADAIRTAIRHSLRYSSTTDIRVHRLVKDFKDMNEEELIEWMEESKDE